MIYKRNQIQTFHDTFYKTLDESSGNIIITTHKNPDYDAMSSAITLQKILREQYPSKQITIYMFDPHIDTWDDLYEDGDIVWLGSSDYKSNDSFLRYLKKDDTVIFLDGSTLNRFIDTKDETIQKQIPLLKMVNTITIDHHANEPDKTTLAFIDESFDATAEMIARVVAQGDIDILNETVSKILLYGILTDTGFFDYIRKENHDIFQIIEMLFKRSGCDKFEDLKSRFQTEQATFDYTRILFSNLKIIRNSSYNMPLAMYSYVSQKDVLDETRHNLSLAKSSFMSQLRRIQGVQLTWTFSRGTREGDYKISLRSAKDIDVQAIAQQLFEGGGHKNAAGGTFTFSEAEMMYIESKRRISIDFDIDAYVAKQIKNAIETEIDWEM